MFFVALLILIISGVLSHMGHKIPEKNIDYIGYISFSADGNKILFDRQKGNGPYQIQVYDLKTYELSAYQPPSNEQWTMARYSNDGKNIVFSIYPKNEKQLQLEYMQLAIMDPDGKYVRKITTTRGPKIYPSFLHSDEKVVFAKARTIIKSGRTPAADFDFYVVDIETGNETRLTFFELFEISPPYFFPDDETIIWGAYGPPDMRKFSNKNMNYYIYIISRNNKKLQDPLVVLDKKNPLISRRSGTRNPLISRDGKHIYFIGLAENPDGIHGEGEQCYEFIKDRKYRQITNMSRFDRILSSALSPDGQYLAIIASTDESRKIVIYSTQDSSSRTISLPDKPSYIINLDQMSSMTNKEREPLSEMPMYGGKHHPDVDQNKEKSDCLAKLGWQYYYQGDLDAAMRQFNQSWMFDHENASALWGFGVIMGKQALKELPQENLKESIRFLELALNKSPRDDRIMVDLAFSHTLLGQYLKEKGQDGSADEFSNAARLYEAAAKINPKYPLLYYNLSVLESCKENYTEAKKNLEKAKKLGLVSDTASVAYSRDLDNKLKIIKPK